MLSQLHILGLPLVLMRWKKNSNEENHNSCKLRRSTFDTQIPFFEDHLKSSTHLINLRSFKLLLFNFN